MPVATELPRRPWPEMLAAARVAPGAVAVLDGDGSPDPLVAAAALARHFPDRCILVVLDAARRPPGVVAAMVATIEAVGGPCLALALRSVDEDGDTRSALVDEVHTVLDALLRGETVTTQGTYFQLDGARVGLRAAGTGRPPILRMAAGGAWTEGELKWQVLPAAGDVAGVDRAVP